MTGPGGALDRARLTGVETYWSDVNTQGGVGGRYVVELDILDHRGDPQIAEQAVPDLLEKVIALTFVNETATGAVHPFLVEQQALGVVPTSTLDWEYDPRFLTHVPPIEAVVLALLENEALSNWCVITDGSPLGIATRNASMRAAEITQPLNVTLIELGEDLNSATSAAACEMVLLEVAENFQSEVIDSLPANREIYVRAGSVALIERTDLQFAYLDSGPAWDVEGDLRRPAIFAANETQEGIDMLGLAEQGSRPRSFNIWLNNNQDEVADQRGWQLERQLATENVDALAN